MKKYTGWIVTEIVYEPILKELGITIIDHIDNEFKCEADEDAIKRLKEYDSSGMFFWKFFDEEGRFP